MALLGIQFVISLIVAMVIQKLSPFYSLARWIMCSGLYRYLHPSNEQLKLLAGKPTLPSKGKRHGKFPDKKVESNGHGGAGGVETFTIPCNLDVSLSKCSVEEVDVFRQYKYQDYKWLVDFSFCALLVYLLIELAAKWRPQVYTEEFNIGFVWCCLVVYFAMKELYLLTAAYWKSDDGGERSMTISFGFFFFVMAMGILVIDESILDFGLELGYKDFTRNLEHFYEAMNFTLKKAPSIWTFKVVLAFFSAFLGAILGFPGIRYANMHLDSIFFLRGDRGTTGVLHLMFFSPFFLLLLWILPLSRELLYITNSTTGKREKLISDSTFLYIRIHLVIVGCLLRLFISRKLLQSHLNTAAQKVAKLKKETGRITNVELQRTVARVFYYLSAAALQYIAPLVLMLFLALILRTLTYNMPSQTPLTATAASPGASDGSKKDYAKLLRSLFCVRMVNGMMSYVTWWTLVTYCITSSFGMVYLKYLF